MVRVGVAVGLGSDPGPEGEGQEMVTDPVWARIPMGLQVDQEAKVLRNGTCDQLLLKL